MAIPLDVNGVVFSYPVTLDEDWGDQATAWAQAVTDGMLQMQGGSFPLTADVNFGPNFGLLSQYFSTRSALPSTVGTIRLSNADLGIGWRNFADSGNLILTTDASDQLLYNGFPIATSGGGAVISITGTADQIIASSPSGAVTLSTPQDIAPTSSPTFASLTLTAPLSVLNGGTGTTTSTGTGSVVLSTSPTIDTPTINSANLITPALGTPSAGVLTNCIGLPIDAGTVGTLPVLRGGTGTTTSTGSGDVVLATSPTIMSPTLVTPALGTPTSGVLTNCTGLPIDAGTTGTLPVARGGTGNASLTAYAVLAGGTTSTDPVQSVVSVGTVGQVLTSNGAGALPTFQNTAGSGTVNSGTINQLAYYAATGSAVSGLTTITANRALVSNINGLPVASTITDTVLSYLVNIFNYRRPVLQFSSVTQVNLETGLNGTSGAASVLFPDGNLRTDSSTTHINFVITRNAVLSGSAQSGLRTSLSEATNTWYALYAVKVSDSSTDFVVVGDTLLPIQANYSTLNSNFGTNSWIYLGLVRNGDNAGATGDILSFTQSGHYTVFTNTTSPTTFAGNQVGLILSDAGSAGSAAYTYSAGTGATQIPNNVGNVEWDGAVNGTAGEQHALRPDSTGTNQAVSFSSTISTRTYARVTGAATKGAFVSAGGTHNIVIALVGFTDTALGIGSNPLL